jgi:clusterin-associated protein 1
MREVGAFVEKLRALGYPRQVSLESFRTPNFELVADVLYWLFSKYEPNFQIQMNIASEEERATFVKSIVTFLVVYLNKVAQNASQFEHTQSVHGRH